MDQDLDKEEKNLGVQRDASKATSELNATHTATPDDYCGCVPIDLTLCDRHEAMLNAHVALVEALKPIAAAYPDDLGTSDLDDEQPVRITLGDVRRVWAALAALPEDKE